MEEDRAEEGTGSPRLWRAELQLTNQQTSKNEDRNVCLRPQRLNGQSVHANLSVRTQRPSASDWPKLRDIITGGRGELESEEMKVSLRRKETPSCPQQGGRPHAGVRKKQTADMKTKMKLLAPPIHLRHRPLPVSITAHHLSTTGQSAVYDIITDGGSADVRGMMADQSSSSSQAVQTGSGPLGRKLVPSGVPASSTLLLKCFCRGGGSAAGSGWRPEPG